MKFLILLLTLLSSSAVSLAGVSKGGDGGHGVVCTDHSFYPAEKTMQLFDIYQLTALHGQSALNNETSASKEGPRFDYLVCDYIKRAADRVAKNFRDERVASAFRDACSFADQINLDVLDDQQAMGEVEVQLPSNCRAVQVAKIENVNGVLRLTVDVDYADWFSRREFAAVLIHESLHNYFEDHQVIREIVGYALGSDSYQRANAFRVSQQLARAK